MSYQVCEGGERSAGQRRCKKVFPRCRLRQITRPLPPPSNNPVQWNAADYARHSASQSLWADDLLARFPLRGDERILDVGCGDGKITARLAAAVPGGRVTGVDASAEMIAHAQAHHARANLAFQVMDARHLVLPPGTFELVFSNAALHWVDDHRAFLRGAARALRPSGRLAVSCGGKGNAQDVFLALRAVLRRAAWREFFRRLERPYFFYAPEQYDRWLPEAGFRATNVRLAEKAAAHLGAAGLAAWLRTTWLPYTQRVPAARREEFVAAVTARYLEEHPLDAAGRALVQMVRLEIEAVRT
jgi:trans-aconitate 2-methyltransferase